MANPQDGSKNLVENAENEPAIGNMTHNSPRHCIVQYCIAPSSKYEINKLAGPPL
jgi:hypothetical protein